MIQTYSTEEFNACSIFNWNVIHKINFVIELF